jgi:hypothetical protein
VICAILPLLLFACNPAAANPSPAARQSGDGSANAVVTAMSAAGVKCEPVTARTLATYVADAVACSIDGKDVVIRTFANSGDRDRFITTTGEFVEQMSFDIDALPSVVGPTWIITTDDEATASRVQGVLGGELR